MRSIRDLAARAAILADAPQAAGRMEIFLEHAYREMVHRCGSLYRETWQSPLVANQRAYTLPTDLRYIIKDSVRIDYAPAAIASITRAIAGGVCTVTVTTVDNHNLVTGNVITVDDVTVTGGVAEFSLSQVAITRTGAKTFTCVEADSAGADGDAGSPNTGYVYAGTSQALTFAYEDELDLDADFNETAGLPAYWFIMDSATIGVSPKPSVTYPALYLEYDAEAPSTLSLTATLPVAAALEQDFLDYAVARNGGASMVEQDALLTRLCGRMNATINQRGV